MMISIFKNNDFIIIIFILLLVFFTNYKLINILIKISKEKFLYDFPKEDRKIHNNAISNLGGVGIYFVFIFYSLIFIKYNIGQNILLGSSLIIFLTGVKDDLIGVSPIKKIISQLLAVTLLVFIGNVRITTFHGFLGVLSINYYISIIVTILYFLLIINSYNLIDGIDGLAGSFGLLALSSFAYIFYMNNDFVNFYLTTIYLVALIAFLIYNYSPAKIFLGDSGSLILGFFVAYFSIKLLETPLFKFNILNFNSILSVIFSIISIPVLDSIRMFVTRIKNRKSPFSADANHIHHILLNLKYNHKKINLILLVVNFLFIIISYVSQNVPNTVIIFTTSFLFIIFMLYIIKQSN